MIKENVELRKDADYIIKYSLKSVLPDEAVCSALSGKEFGKGKVVLVAIGKAAWRMAEAAHKMMGSLVAEGIVITKYGYLEGKIGDYKCFEAGHPVPDMNSVTAAEEALRMTENLTADDTVLFLISGGGSALFEKPLVPLEEMQDITGQLLASGADIVEINTIRKRLSGVKGGRFAEHCAPARVFSIVLSDIIGDPLDMIASGPAYPDSSTADDAKNIAAKYNLKLSSKAKALLERETPKELSNVETKITGSVRELCRAAEKAAKELGYRTVYLTDCLDCEAREAGAFMASIARSAQNVTESTAYIMGGETVVHLKGSGKGGRNQEIALSASDRLQNCKNTAVLSVGSDGSDGPCDAAGGYVDENTKAKLMMKDISIYDELENNNAYYALEESGGLIKTGPTGTNVNDMSVILIKR